MLRDLARGAIDRDAIADACERVEERLARQCMHADIAERRERKPERVGKHLRAFGVGGAVGVIDACERHREPVVHQRCEPLRSLEEALARDTGGKHDSQQGFTSETGGTQRLGEIGEMKSVAPLLRPRSTGPSGSATRSAFHIRAIGCAGRSHRTCGPSLRQQPTHGAPRSPVARVEQDVDRLACTRFARPRTGIWHLRPREIVDREPDTRAMRKPRPRPRVHAPMLADDRLARGDMRANGAAEGLEVGQRDSGMPEPCGLAHQFLGVARAIEEGVVAGDGKFTPAWTGGASSPVREDHRRLLASNGRRRRRGCGRGRWRWRGLAQRMLTEFGLRLVRHAATPTLQGSRRQGPLGTHARIDPATDREMNRGQPPRRLRTAPDALRFLEG